MQQENCHNQRFDWCSGTISGDCARETVKTFGEMKPLFLDQTDEIDPETIVYRVQWYAPVPEGTVGGLFWGTTIIYPGRVGDEFFMTHGHFHQQREYGEFYTCLAGEGMLIMMDLSRETWAEKMAPGSLHYVPGYVAHRVANIGRDQLRFAACWASDAGHDYTEIRRAGFGSRLLFRNGEPALVRCR